jgi:hypothetical protein
MRQALRLLGTRYGAALGLVLLIAIVVAAGKVVGGGSGLPVIGSGPDSVATPTATQSPIPDDGDLASSAPAPAPSTSPGAPDPKTVATNFTRAWLNHTGVSATQWHTGVARYATPTLSTKLDGVDPAGVPANQITGDVTLIDHAESYVDATVPLDNGLLTLQLVATHGRWLVDTVDWQRP